MAQVFKQLPGQSHGGSGHADRVGADIGGAAHLFGHGEGALEQLRQGAAQRARLIGNAHRIFELPQNLRLAQHHRVQTAGHSEGVARCLGIAQGVGVAAQRMGGDAAALRQPVQGAFNFRLATGAVDLGSVAGGDDGGFGNLHQTLAQGVEVGDDLIQTKSEATAQVQWRGGVVDAKGPDSHRGADYKIRRPLRHP